MKKLYHRITSLPVIYILLVADVAILIWFALSYELEIWQKVLLIIITALLMWLLWKGVVQPRRMIQMGMELLSAQEANNRLAPVGQPDADLVAELFNTLMGRLHYERLRLREQNSFLDQLLQASPMGVALLDFDFHINLVNPAFLKLLSIPETEEIRGKLISDIPGNIAPQLIEMEDVTTRTIRCEDHTILRCYRLSFMESGFRRPFILLESLTEEVMLAERSAYGKVIRLMSHEVNNSMTGITTLLEVLAAYHKDDADLSGFITSVNDRCGAMSRFIGAYADVVRLPEPHTEKINLKEFIVSHLPFLRSNSPYPIETAELQNLEINADADMLSQVLVNIIKNSAEAIGETGREDGEITISIIEDEHHKPVLTIADNGSGISPDTAVNLFNPFFSTKPDGQGIGLTMVAEILRRHNARFSLRTYDDGITRFRILF